LGGAGSATEKGLRRNLWVKLAGWVAIVSAMTMRRREDRACGPSIWTATKSACSAPSSVGNPRTPMTTDPKRPTSHRCREAAENQKQTGYGKKIRVAGFASRGTYALSRGWRTVRRFSPVDRPTNSADEAPKKLCVDKRVSRPEINGLRARRCCPTERRYAMLQG